MKKFRIYLANTTLHGFSYISKSRHWIEKIFWILAILCSTVCCMLLLKNIVLKVRHNPVVMYQPDNAQHISSIPFPAISFCFLDIEYGSYEIYASHAYKISHNLPQQCLTNPESTLCTESLRTTTYLIELWRFLKISWQNKFNLLHDVTFSALNWCNTFNVVSYDKMYHLNSTAPYFKYQHPPYLEMLGIKTELPRKRTKNFPLFTNKSSEGFDGTIYADEGAFVVIHSPYEVPDVRHRRFAMENLDLATLTIEPRIKITDETLLERNIEDRRCYKPDERQLQYFKTYTSINCLRECESSFILQKCGCVPYYFINNDTSLICSTIQLECFKKEFEEFNETSCRCYPPCEEISYDFTYQKISSDFNGIINVFQVDAKFKQDSFYPQIYRKYFTMIDWFSFVGGILGLFFGFSFLSAFEVIYHVWRGLVGLVLNRTQEGNDHQDSSNVELKGYLRIFGYFKSYMMESSIHGFSYIFGNDIKIYERIAWTISFILSITACSYMIYELKEKLSIDTVSLVSQNDIINITEILFPAVILLKKFDIDKPSENLANDKLEDDDDGPLKVLMRYYTDIGDKGFMLDEGPNDGNYGHKISNMAKRTFKLKDSKNINLVWNEQYKVPTAEVLNHRVIGEAFNIIPSSEMFTELISDDFLYQFEVKFSKNLRNKSNKHLYGSSYANHENLALEYQASNDSEDFLVSIQSPYDYPTQISEEKSNIFQLHLTRTLDILIIPEIFKTTDATQDLPLNQRMCFMDNERKLKLFKVYTQLNCELECLSVKFLKYCECVPFDIVRDNKTEVCEYFDYKCIQSVKLKHQNEENSCNCLQPCNLISYRFETIDTVNQRSKDGIIEIRFKDNEFVAMQRVQQFTIFDFLSYIGGLLGLFAGISVLSIFEIFYFFTLRMILEILRVRRDRIRVGYEHAVNIVASRGLQ